MTFIKYSMVGAISAGIKFLGFAVLFKLGINYKIAAVSGSLISTVFHYLSNRSFTFQTTKEKLIPQLLRYSVMVAFNLSIVLTVITLLVNSFKLSEYLSMVICIGCCMAVNFTMAKYWVFTKKLSNAL